MAVKDDVVLPPLEPTKEECRLASEFFHASTVTAEVVLDSYVRCRNRQLTDALRALLEIDRLAEAGLCQFSSGGKHAFLRDIRKEVEKLGLQGGLTRHGST